MDKKPLKKTEIEKRDERLLDVKKRDRGDVKKQENPKNKTEGTGQRIFRRVMLSDRGDIAHRTPLTKPDKFTIERTKKINEIRPKQFLVNPRLNAKTDKVKTKDGTKNQTKLTSLVNDLALKVNAAGDSKIEAKDAMKSFGARRNDKTVKNKLRTNVTQRLLTEVVNKNGAVSDFKSDRTRTEPSLKSESKPKLPEPSDKSNSTKTDIGPNKKETVRKPTIKTVRSKNDGRIYKAVTFTDQTHVQPTPLEINIPNVQVRKTRIPKMIPPQTSLDNKLKAAPSKASVKETKPSVRRHRLSARYKRKRLNRTVASPDKFKRMESPPTEVAKWAPCCVNRHTKPYYEAWVNTTLAAISKISKKDKLFLEKQNLIKTFQRSLERPETPELVHENFADETYTGKIKVTQRAKNASKRNKQHPIIGPLLEQMAL